MAEVNLELLKEPVMCPVCAENLLRSFLKRLAPTSETTMMIAGKEVLFECDTCHALFGINNER